MIGRRSRRPSLLEDRTTLGLGALAVVATAGAAAVEMRRVWRRGRAPALAEADSPLGAAAEVVVETAEVARAGYRDVSAGENSMFNLLSAFVTTFAVARAITTLLRRRPRVGPFRDLKLGRRHIHHFVPGIAIAFISGTVALVTRDEDLERWLAIPFGAGMGLTLDESALLLELDDVYWSAEGVVSVQITLAVTALMAAVALASRFLRRGERMVLEPPAG